MAFNKPENVFLSDGLVKKLEEMFEYYNSFKEKYPDVFSKDLGDTYIDFIWDSFPPVNEEGKDKITFDVIYSNNLPIEIKNEFINYLKNPFGK